MPAVQRSCDRLFREEAPENRKKQYFTAILAHSRESLQARGQMPIRPFPSLARSFVPSSHCSSITSDERTNLSHQPHKRET
jgi:hypothetical protein